MEAAPDFSCNENKTEGCDSTTTNFMTCTTHHTPFGRYSLQELDGQDTWLV